MVIKKVLFLTLIITLVYNIDAQSSKFGIIEYNKIIKNPNGTVFATPYILSFDSEKSMFKRLGNANEVTNKTSKDYLGQDGKVRSSRILSNNLPLDFYYTNTKENNLVFREAVAQKSYLIRDTIENINWQLHKETKKVGRYNCQKATAPFRGRKYTAWFTSEIPASYGPWKLRRLPGMILEVSEETGKYEFKATKVMVNTNKESIEENLRIPGDLKKIEGMDVYIKALNTMYEDMVTMILSSLPRGAKPSDDCDPCPNKNNMTLERYN